MKLVNLMSKCYQIRQYYHNLFPSKVVYSLLVFSENRSNQPFSFCFVSPPVLNKKPVASWLFLPVDVLLSSCSVIVSGEERTVPKGRTRAHIYTQTTKRPPVSGWVNRSKYVARGAPDRSLERPHFDKKRQWGIMQQLTFWTTLDCQVVVNTAVLD